MRSWSTSKRFRCTESIQYCWQTWTVTVMRAGENTFKWSFHVRKFFFFFFSKQRMFYAFNGFSYINIYEVCDKVAGKRLSQNGHFNTTPFCDFFKKEMQVAIFPEILKIFKVFIKFTFSCQISIIFISKQISVFDWCVILTFFFFSPVAFLLLSNILLIIYFLDHVFLRTLMRPLWLVLLNDSHFLSHQLCSALEEVRDLLISWLKPCILWT